MPPVFRDRGPLEDSQPGKNDHDQGQLKGETEPHQHLEDKIRVAGHRPAGLQSEPPVKGLKKGQRPGKHQEVTKGRPENEKDGAREEGRDQQFPLPGLEGGEEILTHKEENQWQGQQKACPQADLQGHRHRVRDLQGQQGAGRGHGIFALGQHQGPAKNLHDRADAAHSEDGPCPDRTGTFQDQGPQILQMIQERFFGIFHGKLLHPCSVTTWGKATS